MLSVIEGRPDRAIPILEQGLVVARLAGIAFLVPFITGPLGAAYALDGRADRAVTLLEQTVEQAVSIRLMAHQALRLAWLGQAHLLAGRGDAALELARRALRLAEERRERGQQAYALCLLADIAARDEDADLEVAEAEYHRALAVAEELEMRPLIARCREGAARVRGRLAG
jgi:tetratricopeptide (TPR) repeat protein